MFDLYCTMYTLQLLLLLLKEIFASKPDDYIHFYVASKWVMFAATISLCGSLKWRHNLITN